MRIALIWPHNNTVYQTLPIAYGILYSHISDLGHDIRMFNLPLEGWTSDSPEFKETLKAYGPDVVGFSAWPVSFKSAVAAARVVGKILPEATRVIGGNYATLNPYETYAAGCFDYVLRGEAEFSFPRFLRMLEEDDKEGIAKVPGIYFKDSNGGKVSNPPSEFHDDLDDMGAVDYDFIELERAYSRGYLSTLLGPKRKLSVLVSRGCEHACQFCTAPSMNGRRLRHFSVDFVAREIKRVYDRFRVRMICFQDDNATQDRTFFKSLCKRIADMELKGLSLDLYRGVRLENLDEEMVCLMKKAGFHHLTIAPESGSDRIRLLMGKNMSRDSIVSAARMIRKAGLSLQGYFIVGFPGETAEDRKDTYRMIRELRFDVFSLHRYQALPGSTTFRQLVKQKKITRYHTDDAHLIGEPLPNFCDEDPAILDSEILKTYVKFYLRRPWALLHLFRMASLGGLKRAIGGTIAAGLRGILGFNRPGSGLPKTKGLD